MAMRMEPAVEVWDADLLAWIPGEILTDSERFVTVRADRATYVIPTSEVETRLRGRKYASPGM